MCVCVSVSGCVGDGVFVRTRKRNRARDFWERQTRGLQAGIRRRSVFDCMRVVYTIAIVLSCII